LVDWFDVWLELGIGNWAFALMSAKIVSHLY